MPYPNPPLIRDISKYDTTVPYEDYDAFIVRCYNGTEADWKFPIHLQEIKRLGKAWFPYTFYDFRYPAAPQIPGALDVLQGDTGCQTMAIDVERWGIYQYPPRTNLLAGMKILYDTYLSMTGLKPLWYMNRECIDYLKPIPDWLLGCELWMAYWGIYNPNPEPWPKWTLHQYRGEPDHNQFFGTMIEFNEWLLTPPDPPQEPELPTHFFVDVTSLNIRSAPNPSDDTLVIGKTYYNKKWRPINEVVGTDGKKWWRINEYAYVAQWLTRWS